MTTLPLPRNGKWSPRNLSLIEHTIDRRSDELKLKGEARMSGRCIIHPITKKDDFLWLTGTSNTRASTNSYK
jgi:hypothetical protein